MGGVASSVVCAPAGDAERVVGALTATESLVEATEDASEMLDPVRRRDAASRGRGAEELDEDDDGVGLILAASWLREGRRPAPGAFSVSGMMVQRREGLHSNSDLSIDLISPDAVIPPLLSPKVKLLEQKEKKR